ALRRVEREVIFIEDSPLRPAAIRTPILIQSSPERSPTPAHYSIQPAKEVKKPLHPFFAPKLVVPKSSAKAVESDASTPTQPTVVRYENAPWPSAEDIHCGATRHTHDCPPAVFSPRQVKRPSLSLERSKSSQKSRTRGTGIADFVDLREHAESSMLLPLMGKAEAIAGIPREHRDHPGLERLLDQEYSNCQHNRLWNDKYAPKRAVEVLENTEKAVYLRSWLKELELQFSDPVSSQASRGVKRPRPAIQRD
ncbi:16083_t:CDS:1, partial [Acaulospora colombiana]